LEVVCVSVRPLKLAALVALPPGVVTPIGPAVTADGTVA
jgi:hypothetical protein